MIRQIDKAALLTLATFIGLFGAAVHQFLPFLAEIYWKVLLLLLVEIAALAILFFLSKFIYDFFTTLLNRISNDE